MVFSSVFGKGRSNIFSFNVMEGGGGGGGHHSPVELQYLFIRNTVLRSYCKMVTMAVKIICW